jgi:hypothetical protein
MLALGGWYSGFGCVVHLYSLFGESLSTDELERWVRSLDVEDEYDRLEGA